MPNILVFCRARVMSPLGYHYAAGLVIFFGLHFTYTAVGLGDVCKAFTCIGLHFICTKCFLRQKSHKKVRMVYHVTLHLGHAVSLTNNTYTVLRCRNNYIFSYMYVRITLRFLSPILSVFLTGARKNLTQSSDVTIGNWFNFWYS